jgi:hypothetical protein
MNCSGCGIDISCPNGCGVFCTSDCGDCTSWCEPAKVEAVGGETPGVFVRVTKSGDVKIRVLHAGDKPAADAKKYPESMAFQLSFHDLPRASVARLISTMHSRPVRAPKDLESERLSGSATGTVAEIAARFALVVD